jgi:hypothetical protein
VKVCGDEQSKMSFRTQAATEIFLLFLDHVPNSGLPNRQQHSRRDKERADPYGEKSSLAM